MINETWHMKNAQGASQTCNWIPQDFGLHLCWYIDFNEQARICKQPVWHNPIAVSKCGCQFHMDFGFISTSTVDFQVTNLKTDCIVESFDRNELYLIVCEKTTQYACLFLTWTKKHLIRLRSLFLYKFGHENGDLIWVDPMGEVAHSIEWRCWSTKSTATMWNPQEQIAILRMAKQNYITSQLPQQHKPCYM